MALFRFGGRRGSFEKGKRERTVARRMKERSRRRLLLEPLEDRRVMAILTWVGDVDANWNSNVLGNTNWSGDVLPADGDQLNFAGAGPLTQNNDTAAGNSYTLV